MPSWNNEQECRDFYKEAHDDLTREYYQDKNNFPGGKEAFDQAHGEIWKNMEADLIANGWSQPLGKTLEERVQALEAKVNG